MLFLLGVAKIPVIGFVRPKIIVLNDERIELIIRLRRRTKNHLKSMYFGALAVGADVVAGLHVFYFAQKEGVKVSFAFKSMKADFIQRAETNTRFICNQGALIKSVLKASRDTNERINQIIPVIALNTNGEEVARFEMEISVRVRT